MTIPFRILDLAKIIISGDADKISYENAYSELEDFFSSEEGLKYIEKYYPDRLGDIFINISDLKEKLCDENIDIKSNDSSSNINNCNRIDYGKNLIENAITEFICYIIYSFEFDDFIIYAIDRYSMMGSPEPVIEFFGCFKSVLHFEDHVKNTMISCFEITDQLILDLWTH